jgi:enamidase
MRTELRGLGGVLTGDLASPRKDASAIAFENGRVVSIGPPTADADQLVEAGGAWAMPGLWDGAAALYFGDHEPQFSARGAIAAAVEFGTTTLVGSGRTHVPGWVGDPRSNRELAVLTVKSWRFDRPRGIKVIPTVVEADPSWTSDDLLDLATVGASTVLIASSHGRDVAAEMTRLAREASLRVGLFERAGEATPLTVADVVDLQPDVVLTAGGAGLPVRELLAETRASFGVTLASGLRAATDAVCAAGDRSDLARIFIGSGLPGRGGVLPGAMALFVEVLATTTGLGRDQVVSLASGNVARAYGVDGGILAIGRAADLVLVDPDPLEQASPWSTPVRATFIDGVSAWNREPNA